MGKQSLSISQQIHFQERLLRHLSGIDEAIREQTDYFRESDELDRQEASKDVNTEKNEAESSGDSAQDYYDVVRTVNTRRRAQYDMPRPLRWAPREPLNVPDHIQLVLQETKHDFRRQLSGYTRSEYTIERCELCGLTLNNPVHLIEEA
jgi:hypothetical protein